MVYSSERRCLRQLRILGAWWCLGSSATCATLAAAVPTRTVGNIRPAEAVSRELTPRGTEAARYRSTFPPTVEVSHAARAGCPDERGRSPYFVRPHSDRHDDSGGR